MIDSRGNFIVNPLFVEKIFRGRRTTFSHHLLSAYLQGLKRACAMERHIEVYMTSLARAFCPDWSRTLDHADHKHDSNDRLSLPLSVPLSGPAPPPVGTDLECAADGGIAANGSAVNCGRGYVPPVVSRGGSGASRLQAAVPHAHTQGGGQMAVCAGPPADPTAPHPATATGASGASGGASHSDSRCAGADTANLAVAPLASGPALPSLSVSAAPLPSPSACAHSGVGVGVGIAIDAPTPVDGMPVCAPRRAGSRPMPRPRPRPRDAAIGRAEAEDNGDASADTSTCAPEASPTPSPLSGLRRPLLDARGPEALALAVNPQLQLHDAFFVAEPPASQSLEFDLFPGSPLSIHPELDQWFRGLT